MKIRIILFLFFIITHFINGQHSIRGKVIDINTNESLVFANLSFNYDSNLLTTTDINGEFKFESVSKITHLRCSYVGFDTLEIVVNETTKLPLQIKLIPNNNALNEIIITKNENPALRIIRKSIENKERNNPENIPTFQYDCYNKLVVDLKKDNFIKKRNDTVNKSTHGNHLFLMESVTKRKYIAPDVSEEVVVASRVSGLKNPAFASLATDIQPFAFYQDNIKLLDVYYLNPISNGSLKKYKFRLEETILKDKDTVFV
jgi:hypothetical protein